MSQISRMRLVNCVYLYLIIQQRNVKHALVKTTLAVFRGSRDVYNIL